MRALIVDDEAPARARLRRLLAAFDDIQIVGEAVDGVHALKLLSELVPDVLFLDVQMPEVSGLDVAASLPDAAAPALVFVSAHSCYALPAFDAEAVDYLLKPVDPERLARAVQRLRARHVGGLGLRPALPSRTPPATPPEHLLIHDRGRTWVVAVADILWLQAADNYVTVHTAQRAWLLRRTLAGLLADLGEDFQRTHRSAAVAIAQVALLQPSGDKGDATVRLKNGSDVACSRAHRAALLQRLG